MPSAARALHTTMSVSLESKGNEAVTFQKSIRKVTIDGHHILLRAHIEDFVIACAYQPVLDAFCKRLLEAFERTYEGPGPLEHYLGCETVCDLVASTTQLSQTHYTQEVWRIRVSLGSGITLHESHPLSTDDCGSSPDCKTPISTKVTVASREIETTVFDPASVFLSTH